MVPNQPKQIKRCPNLGTLAIVNLTKNGIFRQKVCRAKCGLYLF